MTFSKCVGPDEPGPFSCCENQLSAIPYAINQTNPMDFSNFAYGDKSETHVERVDCEASGGDAYLGVIMKECECKRGPANDGMGSRYTDVDYVKPEDNGALDSGIDGGLLAGACCGTKGWGSDCKCGSSPISGYGTCQEPCAPGDEWPGYSISDVLDKHIWWYRDWAKMTGDENAAVDCCVMPTNQTFSCCEGDDSEECYSSGSTCDSNLPRTLECPPTHWAGSPICYPIMESHCTYDNWNEASITRCDKYMADFSGAPQNAKQGILISALNDWINNHLDGGETPPQESEPFVEKAANYCAQWPGLCDLYLTQACQKLTSEDLVDNPQLSRLCACFLPDDQYMLPGIIPVECNGMCGINSHPDVNGVLRGELNEDTGVRNAKLCNQTTCVIDDVTISMIDSTISGSVDFSQVCGNCPGGSCTCVMNNVTVDAVNALVTGGIDLEQNCKGCSEFVDGKGGQPIGCDGGPPPSLAQPSQPSSEGSDTIFKKIEDDVEYQWSANKPFYIGFLVFLFFLFAGIVIFLIVRSREKDSSEKNEI